MLLSKLICVIVGLATVVRGSETSAVAYVRNVASDPYNSLKAKVALVPDGSGNVNVSLDTVDVPVYVNQTAGKYELCLYPYGGYTRDLSGTVGTREECQGGVVDSNLNFASATFSGKDLTPGSTSSLVGKALVLEKRSIAIQLKLSQTLGSSSNTFEIQLQTSGGGLVSSSGAVAFSTTADLVLNFDSAPSGTYKLVVTSNGNSASQNLAIGEYGGSDQYWKTYMITTHINAGTGSVFDDFPVLGNQFSNYVATGWNFPGASTFTTTPQLDVPASVLEFAAAGAIGLKAPAVTQDAGGDDSTNRIICSFDDQWSTGNTTRLIFGSVLLSFSNAEGQFRFQTDISGLKCPDGVLDCQHSFHFHQYGDIANGDGPSETSPSTLGNYLSTPHLGTLDLTGDSSVVMTNKNISSTASTFQSLIGVSLTVHDGPSTSNQTVVWGVCGIADSTSCMRYGCPDVEYEEPVKDHTSRSASVSTLVLVLLSVLPLLKVL